MGKSSRCWVAVGFGLFVGCGSATTSVRPGADAGGGGGDAGGSLDGGQPQDAGQGGDAGIDGGVGVADSGTAGGDAGTPMPDAGACAAGATQSCTTSCGSTGTESCANGAFGACVPPREICNLRDDDCSGYCDDILGCRVGVDRAYDQTAGLHFYTTTDSEASCCGYAVETYDAFYLYAQAQSGLVPFYRCRAASGAHLYTTDQSCGGATLEGTMGYIATGPVCGSVPLYGLSSSSGDYLYTTSAAEASASASSGYTSLGTVGYVWPGACGGPSCDWPSPIELRGSALTTVTGFPTAWYGFPMPAGQQVASLVGNISVTNAENLYSEVLFILKYLPSGSCPTGRWPSTTPEFGPPGAPGFASFIVKAPTKGAFSLPINLTLPGGLPISSCVLLGLNGGPVSAPQNVISAASLTLSYGPAQAPTQRRVGMGGEFCFGQNWGCQGATTNDSLSFARVTPITTATQLVALYGDISDSTFDGTSAFGAPPAGAWTASNDFYVYHGPECSSFGVSSGTAGPGSYYASIPGDAVHLLSVPLSGSGIGVRTSQVFQSFTNVQLAAGDCLVTLWGLSGGGGFDDETQVSALVTP
ncbi:MAG: hypothetical protein ACYCWW_10285 [Deltaproteobacteria bacterium]